MKTKIIALAIALLATAPTVLAQNGNGLILASDVELPSTTPGDICTINPDGTGKTYLTTSGTANSATNGSPAWSFDGTKIAYAASPQSGSPNIWTMNANGTNPIQRTSTGGLSPAFSPDGTSILYNGLQSGQREIWVMHPDGTSQTKLTTTTVSAMTRAGLVFTNSSLGSYSPDGTKITYASTQSGRIEIWVMNANGTNQTQLTFPGNTDAPDANAPSWSPDGKKIVFWSGYEKEPGNIWMMNTDGTGRTQLTFVAFGTGVNSDNPCWSPDGTSIFFVSNRVAGSTSSGPTQTWIMNADGSNPRVLLTSNYGGGRRPWNSPTWLAAPGTGDWNTGANWTVASAPNGAANTASFALSSITGVSISASTQVSGITFYAGAGAFTNYRQPHLHADAQRHGPRQHFSGHPALCDCRERHRRPWNDRFHQQRHGRAADHLHQQRLHVQRRRRRRHEIQQHLDCGQRRLHQQRRHGQRRSRRQHAILQHLDRGQRHLHQQQRHGQRRR